MTAALTRHAAGEFESIMTFNNVETAALLACCTRAMDRLNAVRLAS
jgi:hypothetical protein